MKKLLLSASLLTAAFATAQTGINTTAPVATLEIKAKTTDGSAVEGAKLPSQSKAGLAALQANGKTPVEGTIAYVDDVSAGTGTTVANVFEKGYYIFQNGVWNKMKIYQPKTVVNKVYNCTTNNIGQILNATEGYFKCNGDNDPANPAWDYHGMISTYAKYDDGGTSKDILISYSTEILEPTFKYYDSFAAVNGIYNNSNQFIVNGLAKSLPSYGNIIFIYTPWDFCVKHFSGGSGLLENGYATKAIYNTDFSQCDSGDYHASVQQKTLNYYIHE